METNDTTEQKIVLAAIDEFLEEGLGGARMQKIADRAGINKALLHYYFRSKERLFEAIFSRIFGRFFSKLEDAFQSGFTFEQTLQMVISRYMDMLLENPKIPLFIAREVSRGGAFIGKAIHAAQVNGKLKFPSAFVGLIEEAKERGDIEFNFEAIHLIITVIGACVFSFIALPIVQHAFPQSINEPLETFIEKRKSAVYEIIYNGLKPRRSEI